MHFRFDRKQLNNMIPAAGVLMLLLAVLILRHPGFSGGAPEASPSVASPATASEASAPEVSVSEVSVSEASPADATVSEASPAKPLPEETIPPAPAYTLCKEPPQLDSAGHQYSKAVFGCGWFQDPASGGWQYHSENGTIPAGEWDWLDIDGDQIAECFYFTPEGFLAAGMTVENYSLDAHGRWTVNGSVQELPQLLLNDCWFRWNAMDSRFGDNGWKYVDTITPENIYVDAHGAAVRESGIDPEQMRAESLGTTVIAVRKSTHFLEVWQNGKKLKSYVITTGAAPGDKETEGDRRTPEGRFRVCQKNPSSRYTRGLMLNYPNAEDALRGLEAGLITASESEAITAADQSGAVPPFDTALGGTIEIHGARDYDNNSNGCIELLDDEMIELYDLIPQGTTVIIEP